MSDACSEFDPVDVLVDEFLDRHRRGERPSLTEFAQEHPEHAERIRSLVPAMLVLEDFGGSGSARSPTSLLRLLGCLSSLGDYILLHRSGLAEWGSSMKRFTNRWAGTSRSRPSSLVTPTT